MVANMGLWGEVCVEGERVIFDNTAKASDRGE